MAPRLRAVVHTAGSVRSVVTPEVYARGVVVSSQARANALPVAEYTLAMILLSAKGVLRMRDHYRESRGPVDVQAELDGFGTYRLKVGISRLARQRAGADGRLRGPGGGQDLPRGSLAPRGTGGRI